LRRKKNHPGVDAAQCSVKEKQQEVFLVEDGNAVVDPRAVVIHPNDAAPAQTATNKETTTQGNSKHKNVLADAAVVCGLRFDSFAPFAHHWELSARVLLTFFRGRLRIQNKNDDTPETRHTVHSESQPSPDYRWEASGFRASSWIGKLRTTKIKRKI